MKKVAIISIITFWIDQVIKFVIYKNVINVKVIPGFLSLVYIENTGAAFSIFSGNRLFIISISVILILLLMYELHRNLLVNKNINTMLTISYGILFGGIFGNLFDRIINGAVIDYVSINLFGYLFPVFNFADVLIVVGVILLLIDALKKSDKSYKNIK